MLGSVAGMNKVRRDRATQAVHPSLGMNKLPRDGRGFALIRRGFFVREVRGTHARNLRPEEAASGEARPQVARSAALEPLRMTQPVALRRLLGQ